MTDKEINNWLTKRCTELATQLSTDLLPNLVQLRKGYEDTIRSLTESYKASIAELEARNAATLTDCQAALNAAKTEYETNVSALVTKTDTIVAEAQQQIVQVQAERDASNAAMVAAIAAKEKAETVTAQTLAKFDPEIKATARAERLKRAKEHRAKAERLEAGEDVL